MLLSNYFRGYFDGTVEGSAHAMLPGQWDSYRQFERFISPEFGTVLTTVADPPGHYLPGIYSPPITEGQMALRIEGRNTGFTAALIPAKTMALDLTGAGDLDATASLVVSMLLALAGEGDLTASVQGRLNASLDLSGSGDLAADMSGIAEMIVSLLGAGDLEATIAAFGDMNIDIVVAGTGLTTGNVADAVWGALATDNNDFGSMGAKLNSAASGGVDLNALAEAVWGYATRGLTESGLTDEQATQLLEIFKLHGLDVGAPLVVTATSREAGDVSQTISDNGSGTVTVTRS